MTHTTTVNTEMKGPVVVGNMKMWVGTLTITSYGTLGEGLVASDFGMKKLMTVIPGTNRLYNAVWATPKIRFYIASAASASAEPASAVNIGAIQVTVFGK